MNTRVKEGRTALAITVLLIVTLTVPTMVWSNTSSVAQQGSQPSPSGTAPAIQLLNPSKYSPADPGVMMSDKDTNDADTDPEYHFTAVVTNPPPGALVEFFIVQGNDVSFIGNGTFKPNGAVDVVAPIPDDIAEGIAAVGNPTTERGRATVRAILYSNNGGTEVARDDQPVVINQKNRQSDEAPWPSNAAPDEDPSKAGETVEIVYPVHGGRFGFFQPGGSGAGIGVIDVEWSDGTDEVAAYYTVSPTDVDPTWKQCNAGEPTTANADESSTQDGVRCTLTGGDLPGNVTGVAAVARDTEARSGAPAMQPNSGDAHRVVGYSQEVGIVSVEGQTLPATAINGCTDFLDVTVMDKESPDPRPIAGINVDVHAQGPNDNVAFNTHADEQDDFDSAQSDDSNAPQNHPTETGRRCSNDTRSGNQGVHAVAGGFGDRKHIESTRQTDDDGKFVFRLWSLNEGTTRVTAWADTQDDDRFCDPEKGGDSIVTWGAAGSTPPAETAEPVCPTPTPSGSSSSGTSSTTQSPTTSSPTQTTSSPTQTGTTSPTGTATGTVSPTGTTTSPTGTSTTGGGTTGGGTTGGGTTGGTTSPQQAEREVTIETSKTRLTFGRTFTLSGSVTSSNPACTTGQTVRILRDVLGGASEFQVAGQDQTDASGAYSLNFDADRSANYVAEVDENSACGDATSSPQPVLVRVKVSLSVSDGTVSPGQRVRLRVRTAPCPATARDKVLLFRSIEGQFGKSGRKTSSASCRATFVRRVRESTVFQARWPKQTPEFLAGRSRSKAVRVNR